MNNAAVCLFSTQHTSEPWFRQTEGGIGVCGGVRFLLNEDAGAEAEWLFVFDSPPEPIETRIPRERRILVITEPPEVKPYPPRYARQFGVILSPFHLPGARAGNMRIEGACLNWHYGVSAVSVGRPSALRNLEAINGLPIPAKSKKLSVICSDKTYTQAQRDRIVFVEKLVRRFGSSVDVFGRGRKFIEDKAEAIAEYKYHIVLENNHIANFWTEKLSDAYIGYSLPLYVGAPNIETSLPDPGGLIRLPLHDHEASFAIIADLLDTDPYEARLPAIARCREWCLKETNVFERVARIIKETTAATPKGKLLHRPERILPPNRWETAIMRRMYRYGLLSMPK
jgi:hypothetical protein